MRYATGWREQRCAAGRVPPWEGRKQMRNLTSRFVALAADSVLIAGCSTQQPSMPRASATSVAVQGVPIAFRLVPDERNLIGCTRFNTALSRPSVFRDSGDAASITSPGGMTTNMTPTSPGVYAADYYNWGSVTLRAVVNAASSPKSLTVTEWRLGCRFTGEAP